MEPGTRYTCEFIAGPTTEYLSSVIAWFLERQPASWQLLAHDIDEMLELIYSGMYSIALLKDKKNYYAMLLFSLQRGEFGLEATIEFITCDHFHRTVQFYHQLDKLFRELGVIRIKAVAHPTLAKYLLKKLNFDTPGVFVTKTLSDQMRN